MSKIPRFDVTPPGEVRRHLHLIGVFHMNYFKVSIQFIQFFLTLSIITSIISCSSPVPTAKTYDINVATSTKAPPNAEACLKEAELRFNSVQYAEALGYLIEAKRLDPQNQAILFLLGVTYVKLGKGTEAIQEFEATIKVDRDSHEGKTAQIWMEKFRNPLKVAILPLKMRTNFKYKYQHYDSERRKNEKELVKIANNYYESLYSYLSNYALYSVMKFDRRVSTFALAKNNVKIALNGKEARIEVVETTPGTISFAKQLIKIVPLTGYVVNKAGIFNINIMISMDIVQVNNNKIIKNVNHTMEDDKVFGYNINSKLQNMLDEIYNKIAMEINETLL